MDQIKIGKFIAECRKSKNLTQLQLAETLNITDRAVSKWERGKSTPDASIMLKLCSLLGITANELLLGEKIMENNENKTNELIVELKKQKEDSDKAMLKLEVVIGVITLFFLLATCMFASYVAMKEWQRILLICIGTLPLLIATPFMLRIEQKAGYYECALCHHKHVPSYKSVFLASHAGRTRHLKCPACGKKSWQKKVISKD